MREETKQNISKIRQNILILKEKRNQYESKLIEYREIMKKGALQESYTKCSTQNCRCQKGERHGPFFYVNINKNGKIIHKYVGKKEDKHIVESLKKYKQFKKTLENLNKTNREIESHWRKYRNLLTEELD